MQEIIDQATLRTEGIESLGVFRILLVVELSFLCSLLLSWLYVKFFRSRKVGSDVHMAFPLLGIAITSIFICIQFSLPLSLGLLGALSIVRFRTPIKEPEEIGFIMIVVATSLAAATFNVAFMGIIVVATVVALILMYLGQWRHTGNHGVFVITLNSNVYHARSDELFSAIRRFLRNARLERLSERNDTTTLSYLFSDGKLEQIVELQSYLRAISPEVETNVLLDDSRLS